MSKLTTHLSRYLIYLAVAMVFTLVALVMRVTYWAGLKEEYAVRNQQTLQYIRYMQVEKMEASR
jgi:hypothetical protein